ncbi:MAG TPA: hypothetical protein VEU78_06580 [Steroidobacteraceae bacterium]|nr:hypothetical protein [Steroidobacteraceae bacterium]
MKPAALPARCAAALVAMVAVPLTAPAAGTAGPDDPYQPLAFLIGHCWKGAFAGDAHATDEHCFSRIYGGKFVRDEHVVHRDGRPDALGESIYVWDPAAGRLEYLYIESTGGFLRGTVTFEDGALVFPAAGFIERTGSTNLRSRWQRAGDDAYDVVTEFQVKDRWVPGFSLHMQRVQNAPT